VSKYKVYIATTEGPAEIQRLAEEDPDVRSVVCLNGTSEALPISAGYDAFVRKPTGIIEALFGHSVYRMDVASRVSEGRSWQLAVAIAHALKALNKLAAKGDEADHILWLTGEVDRDLQIHAVDHVPEKIERSEALWAQAKESGCPVTLVMAPDNLNSLSHATLEQHHILAAQTLETLLEQLGLPKANSTLDSRQSNPNGQTPLAVTAAAQLTSADNKEHHATPSLKTQTDKRVWTKALVISGFALTAIMGTAYFMEPAPSSTAAPEAPANQPIKPIVADQKLAQHPKEKPAKNLKATSPTVQFFELRAPEGSNCAAVRFGKEEAISIALQTASANQVHQSSRIEVLCGISIQVQGLSREHAAQLITDIKSGDDHLYSGDLAHPMPGTWQDNRLNWTILFSRRLTQDFHYSGRVESKTEGGKQTLLDYEHHGKF